MRRVKNFFALEGQDGTGKATQAKLLQQKLEIEGYRVKTISLPQYGQQSARPIEDYLQGRFGNPVEVNPYLAAVLYAHDRANASKKVKKWLDNGNLVIADRWFFSNLIHQGAKIEAGRYFHFVFSDFRQWLEHLEFDVLQVLRPSLNIILQVPPEISFKLRHCQKGEKSDAHEQNYTYQQNVYNVSLLAARGEDCALIDCCKDELILPPEEINEKIWQAVSEAKYLRRT